MTKNAKKITNQVIDYIYYLSIILIKDLRKGELLMNIKVDTLIPYGNAGDISVTEQKDLNIVSFATHPHAGPECLWFCLRINKNPPILTRESYRDIGGRIAKAILTEIPGVAYEKHY